MAQRRPPQPAVAKAPPLPVVPIAQKKPRKKAPAAPAAAEASQLLSQAEAHVDFLLDDQRDATLGKPYHECGDPRMYTPECLQKRAALKRNPAVKDSIARFSRLFRVVDGMVRKDAYVSAHGALCALLRPDLSDEGRRQLADEDWQADTMGTGVLMADALDDVAFHFADLWTRSAEPTEYCALLDRLAALLAAPRVTPAAAERLSTSRTPLASPKPTAR